MPVLKVGQNIALKDWQTLELAKEKTGKLTSAVYYTVKEHRSFIEQNGNVSYELAKLAGNLYLLIKQASDGEWYGVGCYVPDDFKPGNRADLLAAGSQWVFEEPTTKDWKPNDLKLATQYFNTFDGVEITFEKKSEVHGETNDGHLFTIGEWEANKELDNPRCFFIEYGNLTEETGGFCMFVQGAVLNDEDLEIL